VPNIQGYLSINAIWVSQVSTAIGAIVAPASLGLALWQYLRSQTKRSLSYRATVTTPVQEHSGLELSYKGRPVTNASVVRWTLKNEGTEAIKGEDYDQPIALILGADCDVLEIEVEHKSRDGLQPLVTAGRNRLVFVQQLLNAGDAFTVAAVVTNYRGPPHIAGHVAGVPEIVDAEEATRRKAIVTRRAATWCAAGAIVAVVALLLLATEPRGTPSHDELGLTVRSWSIVGTPFRGQYEFVLGVNAYANSTNSVDVRLERFRLLMTSFDAAHWSPPNASLSHGAAQLDYNGKRVWALPPTANGVSVLNSATGLRTVPSLWSARTLARGQAYPTRTPDGVMTFYLPRRDILHNGALAHVIGLAYVSRAGKVVVINKPGAWGPRQAATDV
jgi:hypothetical protein